jgi:Ca-activated chloride channel family protein
VQSGSSKRTIQHAGIDIAVVLDVSNSMLAEDVKPSRLELARQFASQLIDRMPDQRIALITFAATPILQTPLTIDHSAAELLLNSITADDAPVQGTNMEAALDEALKALPENQQHYRAIVLISDGEEKEGSVADAINELSQERIIICTVGCGTEKGAAIPMVVNDQQTTKRDMNGNIVITKFNGAVLKNIAEKNNGIFVALNSSNSNALNEIAKRLDDINKNLFDEQLLIQYESRFQWFLFPALLLLIFDLFISSKKGWWIKLKNKPGKLS